MDGLCIQWVGKPCFNQDFGNFISMSTWPKIHMQKVNRVSNTYEPIVYMG